jgi:hypothetical protein
MERDKEKEDRVRAEHYGLRKCGGWGGGNRREWQNSTLQTCLRAREINGSRVKENTRKEDRGVNAYPRMFLFPFRAILKFASRFLARSMLSIPLKRR